MWRWRNQPRPDTPLVDAYSAGVGDVVSGVMSLAFETYAVGRVASSFRSSAPMAEFAPQEQTKHFLKHAHEFGFSTEEEYLSSAGKFAARAESKSADILVRIRANGDKVLFDLNTDEFAVIRSDGIFRTYMKPDPAIHGFKTNLDYFEAQK